MTINVNDLGYGDGIRSPRVDNELYLMLSTLVRDLSVKEIQTMSVLVRPVVRMNDTADGIANFPNGRLYYAPLGNPYTSVIPRVTPTPELTPKLELVGRIFTLHTFDYEDRFEPVAVEVFAMMPQHLIGIVRAFEVIGPRNAIDRERQSCIHRKDNPRHVATTLLYA